MLGFDIIEQIMMETDCTYEEAEEIFNALYGYDPFDNYYVGDE